MKLRSVILCLLLGGCHGTMPEGLGVDESGRLAPCPESPNCVASQHGEGSHHIAPILVKAPPAEAMAALKATIEKMPRSHIVRTEANYLHAEFTSRIFRFIDDAEFVVTAGDKSGESIVHLRSAARLGHSDFGVNRKRMQSIRSLMKGGE